MKCTVSISNIRNSKGWNQTAHQVSASLLSQAVLNFRPVTSHLKTGIVFLKLRNVEPFSPLSILSPSFPLPFPSFAFEEDPWNPTRGLVSGERCKLPQQKSNLVHCSLKIWHLVVTMISWDSTDQIPCSLHRYLHFTCETKRTFAPFDDGRKGSSARCNPPTPPLRLRLVFRSWAYIIPIYRYEKYVDSCAQQSSAVECTCQRAFSSCETACSL